MNSIGPLLLAIWLIAHSVIKLLNLKLPYSSVVLPALALSAGILLLWPVIKLKKGIGWLLLSVWLILSASLELFHFSFWHSGVILAIISLLSGFFIIIRK
ncbi:MAG: hypothetical protein ACU85E_11655 [Gammaproteobacteria bacterium]